MEVTFDATYYVRPDEYTPYVARAYPKGYRQMAWMIEAAKTEEDALAEIERRIRRYLSSERPPVFPRTYRLDKKGLRRL